MTTEAQRQELLDIDAGFFSRTLPFPDGEATLAAKSHYMISDGRRHVIGLVSRIIVPADSAGEANRIMREAGFTVPLFALEYLPKNC